MNGNHPSLGPHLFYETREIKVGKNSLEKAKVMKLHEEVPWERSIDKYLADG